MEALLKKKKAALAAQFTFDSVAFKSYRDSVKLRIQGQWRDAGDKLCRAAEQYTQIKMFTEAATLYCEAIECYMKVDKSEALRVLATAVKAHCDIGKFDIAGRLERKIADIHYRIKHFDDAAIHFRKACNFLSGNQEIEQSDYCLEKCAECMIYNGDVKDVYIIYETIAASYVNSNLRRFHARKKLLKALICLWGTPMEMFKDINAETAAATLANSNESVVSALDSVTSQEQDPAKAQGNRTSIGSTEGKGNRVSVDGKGNRVSVASGDGKQPDNKISMGSADYSVPTTVTGDDDSLASKEVVVDHIQIYQATCTRRKPKYDEIAMKIEEFELIDFMWRGSKEKLFIKNLLQFRLELEFDNFVDHLYFWNSLFPFDEISLMMMELPIQEMQTEVNEKKAHDDAKEAKRLASMRGKRLTVPK